MLAVIDSRQYILGPQCRQLEVGLPTVLQDLARVAKDDSRVALLFKTHPPPDDRLAELGSAVGSRLDGIKGQTLEKRFYRPKP